MLRVYCKFSAGCQCRHALRPTTVIKAKQCIYYRPYRGACFLPIEMRACSPHYSFSVTEGGRETDNLFSVAYEDESVTHYNGCTNYINLPAPELFFKF